MTSACVYKAAGSCFEYELQEVIKTEQSALWPFSGGGVAWF